MIEETKKAVEAKMEQEAAGSARHSSGHLVIPAIRQSNQLSDAEKVSQLQSKQISIDGTDDDDGTLE